MDRYRSQAGVEDGARFHSLIKEIDFFQWPTRNAHASVSSSLCVRGYAEEARGSPATRYLEYRGTWRLLFVWRLFLRLIVSSGMISSSFDAAGVGTSTKKHCASLRARTIRARCVSSPI